jgi:hypothetical protein
MKKKDDSRSMKSNINDLTEVSFMSGITIEQELNFLRNQADAVSEQLVQIENRIRDLENERSKDLM